MQPLTMRERILAASRKAGLGLTAMYPAPLDRLPGLEERFRGEGPFPAAQDIADRLLTSPLHRHVGKGDIARIRDLISDAS